MALIRTIALSVAGIPDVSVPSAYALVIAPVFNKLTLVASWRVVCFKDENTRLAFKVAAENSAAKASVVVAKVNALEALKPADGDTAHQIEAKNLASITARAELQIAQANLQSAQRAVNSIQPLQGMNTEYTLGMDASASVVTGDAIDVAKIYEWLKTQPGWEGATDA